jgi:hypothetical protein
VPEFAVEDRLEDLFEPGMPPELRTAQKSMGTPNEPKIPFFDFNAHASTPPLEE